MTLRRLPATYYRGGTSRALVFHARDLPMDRADWDAIFIAAMGVPDPHGRNLDGMGGGLSSLNKVCIVGPPSREDADIDFTFAQLSINDARVDYGGNCGNMSAAIGPFALEEGLVGVPVNGEASVVIHNTNTGKLIRARFPVEGGVLASSGDLAIDGVAGTAAPIRLEFLEPGGAKTGCLLPTGKPIDRIEGVEASLVDAANPCVFVRAADLGKTGLESPVELEADREWLARMEAIRFAGASAMGLPHVASIPKVAMLSAQPGSDITVRMISVGQPHRAVPVTGAVCLAVACRVAGTLAHSLCASQAGPIRIGHPSGSLLVDAEVMDGHATHGAVYRTARRLFEGSVLF